MTASGRPVYGRDEPAIALTAWRSPRISLSLSLFLFLTPQGGLREHIEDAVPFPVHPTGGINEHYLPSLGDVLVNAEHER